MKKKNLATLAMIGVSAGLMMTGCQQNGGKKNNTAAAERMSPEMQAFYNSLTPQAQKQFMEMDAKHRMMAMEMAKQSCKGENACKGMGGCKTSDNSCAGMNACQGQGGPPVKNPNKAIEVQYKSQMNMKGNNNHRNNQNGY